MKESAETHEKGHPHTPYIHVSVSDTLSTYGRLFWRVAFFNKEDMFAAITTQPQCLQNVSTRQSHTNERRGAKLLIQRTEAQSNSTTVKLFCL